MRWIAAPIAAVVVLAAADPVPAQRRRPRRLGPAALVADRRAPPEPYDRSIVLHETADPEGDEALRLAAQVLLAAARADRQRWDLTSGRALAQRLARLGGLGGTMLGHIRDGAHHVEWRSFGEGAIRRDETDAAHTYARRGRRFALLDRRGAAGIACSVGVGPEERCRTALVERDGGRGTTRIHVPAGAEGGLLLIVSDLPIDGRRSHHRVEHVVPGRPRRVIEVPGDAHAVFRLRPLLYRIVTDGGRVDPDGAVEVRFHVRRREKPGMPWVDVAMRELRRSHDVVVRLGARELSPELRDRDGVVRARIAPATRRELELHLRPRDPALGGSEATRLVLVARAERTLAVRAGGGPTCVDLPRSSTVERTRIELARAVDHRVWLEGVDAAGRVAAGGRLCARIPPWHLGRPRRFAGWVNARGADGETPVRVTVEARPTVVAPAYVAGLVGTALLLAWVRQRRGRGSGITHLAFRADVPGYRGAPASWTVARIAASGGGEVAFGRVHPALASTGLALRRAGPRTHVLSSVPIVAEAPGHGARAMLGAFLAAPGMILHLEHGLRIALLAAPDPGDLRAAPADEIASARRAGLAGELIPETPDDLGVATVVARAILGTAVALGAGVAAGMAVPALADDRGFAAVSLAALAVLSAAGPRRGHSQRSGRHTRRFRPVVGCAESTQP